MPRILLIATTTGYQTQAFAGAAERLGFELVLATDRCHVLGDPWGDHAIAVRFEDPESAVERLAEEDVDGIVALGDRAAWLGALVAERLGLAGNPPHAVLACRNKFLARERFHAAGLPVPEFSLVALDGDAEAAARGAVYPCVLKPLGLSASRGVIRADNQSEFAAAFARIRALLDRPEIRRLRDAEDRFVQVEQFIPGREFALEGILTHGALRVLAVFDKPDPLDGPFFEETIYLTPSRESTEVQHSLIQATERAIAALGLRHGPIHAEMRWNRDGVWMLEVAARPIGGLCARVLPGLEELILKHAAGLREGAIDLGAPAAGVMMIPIPREGVYAGVDGIEAARSVAGIEDVIIAAKEGQLLEPLPEGNSYLGFIFGRGGDSQSVDGALREAHARLDFEILSALPVV
ncbi:MAG: ATP-grasp domain-containing protein [Acidobacteriota bacterium]|nr:ATP-grasp domain-containing protein [Acidobacteriota bacterium]